MLLTPHQWYMDNLFIGTTEHNSMSVLMWNLALDGNGQPETPGSNSCNPPCRPIGMEKLFLLHAAKHSFAL